MTEYKLDLLLELLDSNRESMEDELRNPNPDGSSDIEHLQMELQATNELIAYYLNQWEMLTQKRRQIVCQKVMPWER